MKKNNCGDIDAPDNTGDHMPTFVLAGLLALACGLGGAAPTNSKFEPTSQLDGSTLQLNDAGTRYRVVFKVYGLAPYTPKKVSTSEELL